MINKNLITTLGIVVFGLATFATPLSKIDLFPGEDWATGHLEAAHPSKSLFYYLFRCRDKSIKDPPLLLWLEGGPAYSSAVGIYAHGGPYIISNETGKIVRNPYAWNEVADVVFIDQPAGTLFSIATDSTKLCRDMNCVAEDLVAFLLNFMKKYPEYAKRPVYISGISYGGHYVPVFAQKLAQTAPQINLKGQIMFNAYLDLGIQGAANMRFLYERGFINNSTWQLLDSFYAFCVLIQAFDIPILHEVCGQSDLLIYTSLGIPYDPYNIELPYEPDPYEGIVKSHLNRPEVQAALGVNQRFYLYNWTIYYYFLKDSIDTTVDELQWNIQKGLKTYMVYGDTDFMCSALGGQAVAERVEWAGQKEFISQPYKDWVMDGVVKARYKEQDNFKFITVPHSGHSIFYTQRALGLEIYRELLKSD